MSRAPHEPALPARLVDHLHPAAVIVALTIPLAINLARRGTTELATDTLITAQTLGAYVGAENLDDPQALERIARRRRKRSNASSSPTPTAPSCTTARACPPAMSSPTAFDRDRRSVAGRSQR